MSISQRVRDYLDSHSVAYEWLPHSQAFAAQHVAQTLHVSGEHFAKAIVLLADGRPVMAVLPASHRLDLHKLEATIGTKRLKLAPEEELDKLCSDCELGALPPLGKLYGMQVWVDRTLSESENIVFNAGTHTDAVRMKFWDYAMLVEPRIASFAQWWGSRAA